MNTFTFPLKAHVLCLVFFIHAAMGWSQRFSSQDLKAVLVVGETEESTNQAIREMNMVAELLQRNGVRVYKFYANNAIWSDIVDQAYDASFFIYAGHGSNLGPNRRTGGIMIQSDVTSQMVATQLHLRKNALVLFQSVCGGAGSSAGDDGDIGLSEALTRVSDYAYPFFQCGAGAYFAINTKRGVEDCLDLLFKGSSLQYCFRKKAEMFYQVETIQSYSSDYSKKIGIASSNWGGTVTRTTYTNGVASVERIPSSKTYDIAFVGDPDYTIGLLAPNR